MEGFFLIDTGALLTCIAGDVVHALGLLPVNQSTVFGIGGAHVVDQYFAKFVYHHRNASGPPTVIDGELLTASVARLGEHFSEHHIRQPDGTPIRLIGLLGRDFLRQMAFSYHGPSGQFELTVIPPGPPQRKLL